MYCILYIYIYHPQSSFNWPPVPMPWIPRFINWDAVKEHHDLAMNPRHPHVQGTSQGPDIFFQCVEAGNDSCFHVANSILVGHFAKKTLDLTIKNGLFPVNGPINQHC